MTDDQVTQAANLLIEARRTGSRIASLPDSCRPSTPDEAYAIQDAVAARLGAVGGWKVGAGSPQAEPVCAPMPADLIFRSEQHPSYAASPGTEIETEIAFVLGADLPARDTPYTIEDVVAAVASVHAAIELVDSRFADRRSVDRLSLLADSLSNGAFVLGSGQKGKAASGPGDATSCSLLRRSQGGGYRWRQSGGRCLSDLRLASQSRRQALWRIARGADRHHRFLHGHGACRALCAGAWPARWHRRGAGRHRLTLSQGPFENASNMYRLASGAIGDLVPAARAVGDQ